MDGPPSCVGCGEPLDLGARFCAQCGRRVEDTCDDCGAALARNARFCAQCGIPVTGDRSTTRSTIATSKATERRVASVLFADLVGFTAMSESQDPEAVRELLSTYFNRCRDVVDRYGGTVEKFIGDAVMALWGVPVTTDSDAVRAVNAGLELAEQVAKFGAEVGAPELALRVGVVTGEVAVTVGAQGEGLVAGDAVNTAARIQSLAPAGSVWVDEQTRSLAERSIGFLDVGPQVLKGKRQPVRLHEATSRTGVQGGTVAPFVGYEREFAIVTHEFQSAQETGSGRMLLITGEPGVGKSRLADQFDDHVGRLPEEVWWHRGSCAAFGDEMAYSALIGALRGRIAASDGDTPEEVLGKLRATVEQFVSDAEEAAWVLPRLGALLGPVAQSFSREDLFAAWLVWFERLGATGNPVVWVIDDLHQADDALLDFLDHLLRAAIPLFVLALARPELLESRPTLAASRRVTSLRLHGLSEVAMSELVDWAGDDLEPAARRSVVEAARGNPLYALELMRAGEHAGDRDLTDPTTALQVLIASRLDLLGEDLRVLAQEAAALGSTFTAGVLAAVTARSVDEVEGALVRLVERDVLTVVADPLSADHGHYAFAHTITRQVAYQMLSRRDRARLHTAAAERFADLAGDDAALAPVVARHLVAARDHSDPASAEYAHLTSRAVRWIIGSAERSRGLGALSEAHQSYLRALDLVTDSESRVPLLLAAASTANDIGRAEAAIEYTDEAESLQGGRSAETAEVAGLALMRLWRNDEALERLRPYGTRAALSAIDPRVAANIARRLAWLSESDVEEAHRLARLAINLAAESGDDATVTTALDAAACLYMDSGDLLLASVLFDEAERAGARSGDRSAHLHTMSNGANLLKETDPAAALSRFEELYRLLAQSGSRPAAASTLVNLAITQMTVGDWDQVLTTAEQWPLNEQGHDPVVAPDLFRLRTVVDQIRLVRGLPLGPPDEQSDSTSARLGSDLLLARALDSRRDDPQRARDVLAEALRANVAVSGFGDDAIVLWALLGDWCVADDVGSSVEVLEMLGMLEPTHNRLALHRGEFLRLRGWHSVTTGDADAGEADLRAAVEVLDSLGAAPGRARAQAVLGRHLVTQGRAAESTPLLDSAARTFSDLGAAPWLAEFALTPTHGASS